MNSPSMCKCGNEEFYFIGVQSFPFAPWFVNLFNCYKCKTTISVEQNPRAQSVRTRAVPAIVFLENPGPNPLIKFG